MSVLASEKALEKIFGEMLDAVKNSKSEIFNITESARHEHESLRRELEETKQLVINYIEESDKVERNIRASRKRLAEVSRDFDRYTEKDIREVYANTHKLQMKLTKYREKERHLRQKRDDLERRLVRLDETIKKAEGLASKVSVIQNYLEVDIPKVNEVIAIAKEKQEFGLKIIQAQEEERRRLSREIHDGPAQMLANILLRTEIIERTLGSGTVEDAMAEIRSVRKMIRSSLYEVRRIIYDLRPMVLDDLGLVPTIKKYIRKLEEYNNIEIDFVLIGEERRLPEKYEVALFRLMQESAQNAIKHANPKSIQIKLEIQKKNIIMIIKDTGKGFDTTVKKSDSFGLIGMRERVEMLEGELTITSKPDVGTTILIKVPFKPEGRE